MSARLLIEDSGNNEDRREKWKRKKGTERVTVDDDAGSPQPPRD